MLTDSRKEEFARQGFLVIRDAAPADAVAAAREQVWDAIEEAPDDPDNWGDNRSVSAPEDVGDPEPFAALNRTVYDHCAALVGDGLDGPGGASAQLALRFPSGDLGDPDGEQLSDVSSHVDGFLDVEDGEGDVSPHTIMGTLYLDRVEPYGGGFTVWPGSHLDVCRYMAEKGVTAGKGGVPAPDGEGGWQDASRDEVFDPLELTGDAGDLVLWHGRLEHEGGINHSPNLRMAHIARYYHEDAPRIQEERPGEPFAGWVGMEGVAGSD